jgi:MFS family permease
MNSEQTRLTWRHERGRAVAHGIYETASQTFLLLIAVQFFQAGPTVKALVASGGSIGMILSPVIVTFASRMGWTPSQTAARLALLGALSFLVAALWPVLPVFTVCSVAGMTGSMSAIPMLTQIYQENYPATRRGAMYARTMMIRVGVAAAFSDLAGRFLSGRLDRFQWLLLVYAGAFALAARCLSRIPSRPLTREGGSHPFRALRYVREDRLFRWTLISWMLMGFANLMMVPLRVDYLANPRHGLAMAASTVALLTGVIPNLAKLLLSPLWGWLFDRMNFFLLRCAVNLGFALAILAFFTSRDLPGLLAGAILFGVAMAGGDVVWSLWVTKFSPPDRVADYMAVHIFSVGLRGAVAPMVAFHVAQQIPILTLGLISAGLIVAATLILAREIKLGKAPDPATTIVEKAAGQTP